MCKMKLHIEKNIKGRYEEGKKEEEEEEGTPHPLAAVDETGTHKLYMITPMLHTSQS